MKVEFKDTFFESVEKLVWYDTKLWKVWEFIRRGIPTFFGNIWKFRKELYSHQWWDYRYTLEMLYRSLTIMEKGMHDGIEVRESRDKKIAKMQRAIELLKHKLDDDYVDRAESELGQLIMHDWKFEDVPDRPGYSRLVDTETKEEKAHNSKVFKLARSIEDREWRELWNIFKGQSMLDYKKFKKTLSTEEQETAYNKWFNGSDMRGWWD
jgi:hypothetical protein